jgi:hypothetical protein
MGFYVHIHVSFACDHNEPVAALAKKHLAVIADEDDARRAARWFLSDLSERTGENRGPKGGVSLWGMIGNYTPVDQFCEVLRPFWRELLETPDCGPLDFEHIVVFQEREQSERAQAFEIFLDDGRSGDLVIREHDLPFCWGQY